MAQGVPRTILTHSQRVCRLYKRALRTTEEWCASHHIFRYHAVLLRNRFDETRHEKDFRKLAAMLEDGEEEVWREQHPQPFKFKNDPGGILHDREGEPPDAVLDYWHPWEKARYIDYFEQREKMKEDYLKYYDSAVVKKGEKGQSEIVFPSLTQKTISYIEGEPPSKQEQLPAS